MSSGMNPQTPKKTYKATAGAVLCCCRLCRSTGEVHFKNIFAKGNRALLSTAEEIYGRSLEKDDLPHLLCRPRPCERRLKSFQEFKLKITVTQDSFERVKRCIEVSPSVTRTSSKSAKDSVQTSSRRGLNFNAKEMETHPGGSSDHEEMVENNETHPGGSSDHEEIVEINETHQGGSSAHEEMVENNEITRLLCQVETELTHVARRQTKSILRERGYPGMSTLSFQRIFQEMSTLCPTVYSIISQMMQVDTGNNQDRKFVDRLHSYNFCLSKSMKYVVQEEIGKHFLDRAVKLCKEGRKFVFVLDNIDWDVRAHDMRSNKQNRSVHAVATSIVFDRVASPRLPDKGPKRRLAACNLMDLLSLTEEVKCTQERYEIFIARLLCECFPSFDCLKDVVPAHTICQYP